MRANFFGSTCGGENGCLYEQLVMYLGAEKNRRQKEDPSVNVIFWMLPVVERCASVWCCVVLCGVVLSQVFVRDIRGYTRRM